jgi:hypothetical protein
MPAPLPDPIEPPDWMRWSARGLVVLPILVAVVRAVATGWFPVGDSALLAIRAFDVGTSHHPLLGSWTSASLTLGTDVNNPGPLYPDLLSPFMWTFGRWFGIGTGIAIGVGAVNVGFAAMTARVGHLLGGWRVERWALLMVAALSWSMGSELLIDIWQPHALLIPFACFLLMTAGLIDGHWRMLPAWLGLASLIVQTHIGYVYVLAVLGLVVTALGIIELRAVRPSIGMVLAHRITQWSAAVVAVAWIQPLIEQVAGEGRGNLARLASNAGGGDVTIGAGTAVKLVARVVALPPWWSRFGFEDSVVSTPLTQTPDGPRLLVPELPGGPLALVAVVALSALLTWLTVILRRRDLRLVAAATLVSVIGVATAVATLTIQTVSVVGLGSHHVRWLWVLSLFVQISILWAVVELCVRRVSGRVVSETAIVIIALLAVANLGRTAHDLGPTADRAAADTLERTFADLSDFDPGGPVVYDVGNLRPFEPWSSAVQMRLRETGVDFRVADEGVVRQLGNGRRADGQEITTIRQIERSAALRYDGPGCVISRASPYDATDEARIDTLIAAAVVDLASGRVGLRLDGLPDDLRQRFEAAVGGDADEAFVLVADGVLSFLDREGRITGPTEAVSNALLASAEIDRRVGGTLILVTDPPVGCR